VTASRNAPYVAPTTGENAFNCPHCHAYAKQHWGNAIANKGHSYVQVGAYMFSTCERCDSSALWDHQGALLYPSVMQTPSPNEDMPDDVRKIYQEAELVFNASPRSSAALLRLCVQMLCAHLGEKGHRIDDDIKSMVSKGLPESIQQALDVVRVVGNNAVHPGQIKLDEDRNLAGALFSLVNRIVQNRITEPREAKEWYASLPQANRDAIEKRDKT
jgi:hypothetical protein